ncbi:hypothetical protein T439DRAFT_33663 [Meredithblackwellia eburnea MCA 4105]
MSDLEAILAGSSSSSSSEPKPSTSAATTSASASASASVQVKRRSYRACLGCRAKKLRCDLGDVDAPQPGPCKRCRREMRECIFEVTPRRKAPLQSDPSSSSRSGTPGPTGLNYSYTAFSHVSSNPALSQAPLSLPLPLPVPGATQVLQKPAPTVDPATIPSNGGNPGQGSAKRRRLNAGSSGEEERVGNGGRGTQLDDGEEVEEVGEEGNEEEEDEILSDDDDEEADEDDPHSSNALLSTSLHNPSDALRLLAKASLLRSNSNGDKGQSGNHGGNHFSGGRGQRKMMKKKVVDRVPEGGGWEEWPPLKLGLVAEEEARVLVKFYETDLQPLYPLLSPQIFEPHHLHHLTSTEALLLATIISIASRFYTGLKLGRAEEVHKSCSRWAREEISFVLDGTSDLRHVSTVESLLLFSEWPPIPVPRHRPGLDNNDGTTLDPQSMHNILRPSKQYDSLSWLYIGCAVRLAQELSLDEKAVSTIHEKREKDGFGGATGDEFGGTGAGGGGAIWEKDRLLRTWLHCYNSDRHVSARLGRNALIQAYLPTQFWEQVTARASSSIAAKGPGGNPWTEAALPEGMIAVMMGTIADRLYPSKEVTRAILRTGQWEGFLRSLSLERQFIHLTASNILGRAGIEPALLQIEMDYVNLYGDAIALRSWQERKRRRVKVNDFATDAPLFSLAEGVWIIEAMAAARSILRITVKLLEPKGCLRLVPCRIFQRILFAATFLLKGLATGAIEHEQDQVLQLLAQTISALESASLDPEHLCYGFSALLRHLYVHTQTELASLPAPPVFGHGPTTSNPAMTLTSEVPLVAPSLPMRVDLQLSEPEIPVMIPAWDGNNDYSPFQSMDMRFPWDSWDGFDDMQAQIPDFVV